MEIAHDILKNIRCGLTFPPSPLQGGGKNNRIIKRCRAWFAFGGMGEIEMFKVGKPIWAAKGLGDEDNERQRAVHQKKIKSRGIKDGNHN